MSLLVVFGALWALPMLLMVVLLLKERGMGICQILMAWVVTSIPAALFIGRFIAAGKGPKTTPAPEVQP